MNRTETMKLLTVLGAAYPRTEITKETVELYISMLEDVPYKTAKVAVQKHIATEKWFPTVAEIRKSAMSVIGTNIPDAASAWLEVMQQIREAGFYKAPHFSCDEVKKAVEGIGWQNICLSANIAIERAHFLKTYAIYEERAKETAQLPPNVRQLIDQVSSNNLRLIK